MTRLKLLCLMSLLVFIPWMLAPSPAEAKLKTITYVIKKGDTLSEIAKKHNVTVTQIQRWNKGVNPTSLRLGAKLRLAVPAQHASARRNSKYVKRRIKHQTTVLVEPDVVQTRQVASREIEELAVLNAPSELIEHDHDHEEHDLDDAHASEEEGAEAEQAHEDVTDEEVEDALAHSQDAQDDAAPEDAVTIVRHIVQPDETVGSVALKYRVDPEQLRQWNALPDLQLPPGVALLVKRDMPPPPPKAPLPVTHRVKRGETFLMIAKKYGVSPDQLKKWNRKVKPSRLSVGQTLQLHVSQPRNGRSASYGTPNRGRLYNGVPLESGPGLRVRMVSNAYGTRRVVNLLRAAAADVKARWPETAHLVLGDISYRQGGRIKRHKSHQSGRDADLSYYHRGNVQLPEFRALDEDGFDPVKNWHIFKMLIDTGEVEYIFVDYGLQKVLYQYALAIGYTPEELAPLIQYPNPVSSSTSVIRHVRGHDDHWHIRFRCGARDRSCR